MSTISPSPALRERISAALSTNAFVPAGELEIEADSGHVRLSGRVGSYFHKQMAQEAIRRIDGVQRIENLLEVTWA